MTQVTIQGTASAGYWGSTATPTIPIPACTDTHQQLLILTWDAGGSVSAPTISGWEKAETYISGEYNRMAVYKRAPSGGAAAGNLNPTFAAATYGMYWCASFNGSIPSISLSTDAAWTNPKTVAGNTAADDESLHVLAMTSGSWPRTVLAVSGYAEVSDSFIYTSLGGAWIAVLTKAVSSGAVASTSWPITEEDGTTAAGTPSMLLNVVLSPLPSGGGSGSIEVDADFPLPGVSIAAAGGNLGIGEAMTVTATVVDQFGAALRNATVGVGSAAGGVYTSSVPAVTNADGETSFTVTGAAEGTAAIVCSVGTSYSNELTVTVIQAPSNVPLADDEEDFEMQIKKDESIASRRIVYFGAANSVDGSAYTSTLSGSDIKISKAGGAEADSAGVATHIATGTYKYEFAASEIDTYGEVSLRVAKSGLVNSRRTVQVVAFDPCDPDAMGVARISGVESAVLDAADGIETGLTLRQALRGFAAVIAGLTTGAGTGTEVFRAMKSNSKPRVTTTMTGANRTGITLDLD